MCGWEMPQKYVRVCTYIRVLNRLKIDLNIMKIMKKDIFLKSMFRILKASEWFTIFTCKIKIEKVEKLVCSLHDKKGDIVNIKTAKKHQIMDEYWKKFIIYLFTTLFNASALEELILSKNRPLNIITKENNDNNNKDNNSNNKSVLLHLHIHVWHIKQPSSISLKFFMLSLSSHTDLLDFMKLGKLLQIRDCLKCIELQLFTKYLT